MVLFRRQIHQRNINNCFLRLKKRFRLLVGTWLEIPESINMVVLYICLSFLKTRWYRHPKDRYYELFLFKGLQFVGSARIRIRRDEPQFARLYNFTICPHFRGQGLSKIFLEKIFSFLRKKNVRKLDGHVAKDNGIALNLYCKMGFSLEEKEKKIWIIKYL